MRDQLKTKMLFPIGVMLLLTSVITQSRIYPYTHNKWLFVALGALLGPPSAARADSTAGLSAGSAVSPPGDSRWHSCSQRC